MTDYAPKRLCGYCRGSGFVFDHDADPASTKAGRDFVRGQERLLHRTKGDYLSTEAASKKAHTDIYLCPCTLGEPTPDWAPPPAQEKRAGLESVGRILRRVEAHEAGEERDAIEGEPEPDEIRSLFVT